VGHSPTSPNKTSFSAFLWSSYQKKWSYSSRSVRLSLLSLYQTSHLISLVNIGAASLTNDPTAHTHPFLCQVQEWNAEQEENIKAQLAMLETKITTEAGNAKKNKERGGSEEAQRKRKEREEKKAAAARAKALAEEGEKGGEDDLNASRTSTSWSVVDHPSGVVAAEPEHPAPAEASSASAISTFSASHPTPYTITIPASSSSLSWYNPNEANTYASLDEAREAGVWDYPSNLEERARCGVFRDLWKQGYYMGGGIKFGGEYLVYPGLSLHPSSPFRSIESNLSFQAIHCATTRTSLQPSYPLQQAL
jgi:tRNA-splicing endonuclease subunit Sen34